MDSNRWPLRECHGTPGEPGHTPRESLSDENRQKDNGRDRREAVDSPSVTPDSILDLLPKIQLIDGPGPLYDELKSTLEYWLGAKDSSTASKRHSL